MKTIDNLKAYLIQGYSAWALYFDAAINLLFEYGLGQTLPLKYQLGLVVLILAARSIKQEPISGPAKGKDEEIPTYV